MVDLYPQDPARRVLSMEEGLQVEADEYIIVTGGGERSAVSGLAEPIVRLKEGLQNRLQEGLNTLREVILSPDIFSVTWEQIPGRGAFEMQQEEVIENAREPPQRENSCRQCHR